jgi:hypothetical protein
VPHLRRRLLARRHRAHAAAAARRAARLRGAAAPRSAPAPTVPPGCPGWATLPSPARDHAPALARRGPRRVVNGRDRGPSRRAWVAATRLTGSPAGGRLATARAGWCGTARLTLPTCARLPPDQSWNLGLPATSTEGERDFVMARHDIANRQRRSERSGARRLRRARRGAALVAPRTNTMPRATGNRESIADASEAARAIAATIRSGIANRIGRP